MKIQTLKLISISLMLLLTCLIIGCTERVELDLNSGDNQKLVVEGELTNEVGPHYVRLTESGDYFDNTPSPAATNAIVKIDDGFEEITLEEVEPGLYATPEDYQGKIGRTYELDIAYKDVLYEASSYMDTVPEFDSLRYDYQEEDAFEFFEDGYYVYFSTTELAGEGDTYMWRVYRNGILENDTLNELWFANDDLVDGNPITDIALSDWTFEPGDTCTVKMYNIPVETHDYFTAVMTETEWRGFIFDSPPANIQGNISNGALGMFFAASCAEASIFIE